MEKDTFSCYKDLRNRSGFSLWMLCECWMCKQTRKYRDMRNKKRMREEEKHGDQIRDPVLLAVISPKLIVLKTWLTSSSRGVFFVRELPPILFFSLNVVERQAEYDRIMSIFLYIVYITLLTIFAFLHIFHVFDCFCLSFWLSMLQYIHGCLYVKDLLFFKNGWTS